MNASGQSLAVNVARQSGVASAPASLFPAALQSVGVRPRALSWLLVALVCGCGMFPQGGAAPTEVNSDSSLRVYVGTYTGNSSRGIYRYQFDAKTGALAGGELAVETTSPSFLALHPTRPFLYAVNEIGEFQGRPEGAVSAFAINSATGQLKLLNQVGSAGGAPCHLTVDRAGRFLLVANYTGGNAAAFEIKPDGSIGQRSSVVQHHGSSVNPNRQKAPHAHGIYLDRAERFVFVPDLGIDRVMVYGWDGRSGDLDPRRSVEIPLKPGAGPRHVAFHPSDRALFVLNELHSTVTAFAIEPPGTRFRELQTLSTLPDGFTQDNTTAEIVVHPSGRSLYASNRGHNSIAVFQIEAAHHRLKWVQNESTQGRTPRNFALDPTGRFLVAANQDSQSLMVFRIDADSGRLSPVGKPVATPTPVCVVFVPTRTVTPGH